MNPGEYIGKDGRTYRWDLDGGVSQLTILRDCDDGERRWTLGSMLEAGVDESLQSLKAALDTLTEAEAEAEEWVHIGYGIYGKGLRISRNGEHVQIEYRDGTWHDARDHYPAAYGYRKGCEVALEQVRELVKAVNEAPEQSGAGCVESWVYPHAHGWERIRELAKVLEAILLIDEST